MLRAEITCLVILAFLGFYYMTSKEKEKGSRFFLMLCIAFVHVVFSCVTIYTVNHLDTVPDLLNRACHVIFYISGLTIARVFYSIIMQACYVAKHQRMLDWISRVPLITYYAMCLIFSPQYIVGESTNYSSGLIVISAYLLFLFYSYSSCITLLLFRKRMEHRVFFSLFPMVVVLCGAVFLQAFFPELLITPGCLTFMCLGTFVALDNPDKKYKEQALWDYLTGLRNRNCYDKDVSMYKVQYDRKNTKYIGFVVADLNNLKKLNDSHGHAEGDHLISAAANLLQTHLKSANTVYRIGGDEFAAIYLNPNTGVIRDEIAAVHEASKSVTVSGIPLEIAVGFCVSSIYESGSLDNIFDEADRLMYENKAAMKGN